MRKSFESSAGELLRSALLGSHLSGLGDGCEGAAPTGGAGPPRSGGSRFGLFEGSGRAEDRDLNTSICGCMLESCVKGQRSGRMVQGHAWER